MISLCFADVINVGNGIQNQISLYMSCTKLLQNEENWKKLHFLFRYQEGKLAKNRNSFKAESGP